MNEAFSADDRRWMARALALAQRGRGRVEPNPMVGCVVVRRGRLIGEGYHRRFGGPHAEVDALARCQGSPRDATLYVTLEPCCHAAKTPPCTTAVINAAIRRVVIPMRDPFSQVAGGGIRRLRRAGLRVDVGLCRGEAEAINAPYLKLHKVGLPWIILKWAQSLDGKIATRRGESKWISSAASRRHAHRLRGRVDAIVVGIGTALADDPLLTCRLCRPKRIATRVVLDSRLRLPLGSQLVRTARDTPLLIATTRSGLRDRAGHAEKLRQRGALVLAAPPAAGRVGLTFLLRKLARQGMTNVLVEGGGRVLGTFFDAGLADEACVYVAPRLIGGRGAVSPLAGRGLPNIAPLGEPIQTRRLGPDTFFHLHGKGVGSLYRRRLRPTGNPLPSP